MKELVKALVSVIVPIHQAEKNLAYCVHSIQRQSYKHLEIFLVENGSTDGSFAICMALAQSDMRITAVKIDAANVSQARNWGIEHAQGKYLCFVDADDYLEDTFIEMLLDGILCEDAELSVVDYWVNDLPHSTAGEQMVLRREEAQCFLFREDGYKGFVWNKLFLADLVRDGIALRFQMNISYCEDLLFVFDYLQRVDTVVYTRKPYYHYAVYSGSTVFSSSLEKRVSALTAYERILSVLALNPTEAYQYAMVGQAEICRGLMPLVLYTDDLLLRKRVQSKLRQGIWSTFSLKVGVSLRTKLLMLLASGMPKFYCWLKIRTGGGVKNLVN